MAIPIATSSPNRVFEGGTGQRLRQPLIDALIAARGHSLDWFTYLWKGAALIQVGAAATGEDPFLVGEGTNNIDAQMVFNVAGPGMRITTAGADADQCIVAATQAEGIGSLAGFWDTRKQMGIYATIRLDTAANSLHNARIFCGFKLTGTDDPATDLDQAMWIMDANSLTAAQPWQSWTELNGVEFRRNHPVAVASEVISLGVLLGPGGIPTYVMNGQVQHVGPALRDLATLEPRLGIAARGEAAGKILDVINVWTCSFHQG